MEILLSLLLSILSLPAFALVSSPVPVGEGDWDVSLATTFERGKIEPNENTNSYQKALTNLYRFQLGHGFGDCLGLSDCYVSVSATYFHSREEAPQGHFVYAADQGTLLSASWSFNFVHVPAYSFGGFVQTTIPVSMDEEKFSNPLVDYFSLGTRGGMRLSPHFFVESLIYAGMGIPQKINARLASLTTLGWEPFSGVVIKAGPYLEVDLTERTDARYDALYSPSGTTDRIRSAKVGFALFPAVKIFPDTVLSASYVQKIGGYDVGATQFYQVELKRVF